MRTDLHPCYILHHRPYRETSLLLDIFSLNHGRLGLVARGVKKGKRGRGAMLQPMRRLNLAWSGRSELGTLTGVEADGEPYRLSGQRLLPAFYLNELLLRLLHPYEPDPQLFNTYEICLSQLAGTDDEGRILRMFEKRLLQTLGYGLVLDRETLTGDKIHPETVYYYHFDHGPDISKLSSHDAVRISGRTLLALNNEDVWDEDIARESKSLLRNILDRHLDNRPLHSRELYKAYLKNRQPA